MGQHISPAILEDVRSLFAPLLRRGQDSDVSVTRDIPYGPHARHRLNVFSPTQRTAGHDVLVFVYGGGFVTGDKEEVPQTFYDNVGYWAASQGMIGVTINYRLAPDHPWPAGHEDVAAAVSWVRDTIADYAGLPERIFLMGHSAGAAHVAGYIANVHASNNRTTQIAGAICVSGLYDLRVRPVNPRYFGEDETLYSGRSPLPGLAKSDTPLLITVAENDPEFIQRHALSLFHMRLDEKQTLPHLCQLRGHNHFSAVLHLNSQDTSLGDEILTFIQGT